MGMKIFDEKRAKIQEEAPVFWNFENLNQICVYRYSIVL